MTTDPFAAEHGCTAWTMADAKIWLRKRFSDGDVSHCPLCGQTVQRYSRRVTSKMVKALAIMAQHRDGIAPPDIMAKTRDPGGDYAKLRLWGLARQDSHGLWHCTGLGHDFLRGQATIHKFAYVYNDMALGLAGDQIAVAECVRNKFDLEALLADSRGAEVGAAAE